MEMTLSDSEADLLNEILANALSDLRMEIVGTDLPAYRRELRERRVTLEAIHARLVRIINDLTGTSASG
jgi:hypothetical protein